jgi:hypothetical protein
VAQCAVCTWHVETWNAGFLVEPQNQGGGGFPGLGLKITATVSWFGPQNHVGFGLSVAPQNRRREVGTGHASRSSSLLGIEASLARVFLVWPEDWRRRDDGWCTWHHRGGCVGGKLKMDRSMRWTASDPVTLALPFSFY